MGVSRRLKSLLDTHTPPRSCVPRFSLFLSSSPQSGVLQMESERPTNKLLSEAQPGVQLTLLPDTGSLPAMLNGIRVVTLQSQTQSIPGISLLKKLAESDDLIECFDAARERVALVSYRQERRVLTSAGTPCNACDEFTLDVEALNGIVEAAVRLNATAVWCDVWCYRVYGVYNHADFIETLNGVVQNVSAVIWLPRSKRTSRGEYAYRLWCSFEAACVHKRALTVAVAGVGLSRLQRRVRIFGSFVPAVWADGTINELALLNLCAYFCCLSLLFQGGTYYAYRGSGLVSPNLTNIMWILLCFFVAILQWLAGRRALAQQVRWASNARSVLSIMTSGPEERAVIGAPSCAANVDSSSLRIVQCELPWLGAYDRRDCLVVNELIAKVSQDAQPSSAAVLALALSANIAAQIDPSAGDGEVNKLSLQAWLSERDIDLGRSESSQAPCEAGSLDSSRDDASSWCLGVPLLRSFGWTFAPGASCAVYTPAGAYFVPAPTGGRWSISFTKRMSEARVGLSLAAELASWGMRNVGWTVINLIIAYQPQRIGESGMVVVVILLESLRLSCWLAVFMHFMHTFWQSIRIRRVPLPPVVFNRARVNIAACLISSFGSAIWLHFAVQDFGWVMKAMSPEILPLWKVPALAEGISNVCFAVFAALEAALLATLLIAGSLCRAEPATATTATK